MMILNSSRGSFLLETSLALLLVISLVSAILLASYICFAKSWCQHCAYEAAICLARSESIFKCKQHLIKKIKNVTPIGGIEIRKFEVSDHIAWVSIDFKLPFAIPLAVETRLTLPIKPSVIRI